MYSPTFHYDGVGLEADVCITRINTGCEGSLVEVERCLSRCLADTCESWRSVGRGKELPMFMITAEGAAMRSRVASAIASHVYSGYSWDVECMSPYA